MGQEHRILREQLYQVTHSYAFFPMLPTECTFFHCLIVGVPQGITNFIYMLASGHILLLFIAIQMRVSVLKKQG